MLYVVVQCIPIAGNEDNSRIEIEEINIKRKYLVGLKLPTLDIVVHTEIKG